MLCGDAVGDSTGCTTCGRRLVGVASPGGVDAVHVGSELLGAAGMRPMSVKASCESSGTTLPASNTLHCHVCCHVW